MHSRPFLKYRSGGGCDRFVMESDREQFVPEAIPLRLFGQPGLRLLEHLLSQFSRRQRKHLFNQRSVTLASHLKNFLKKQILAGEVVMDKARSDPGQACNFLDRRLLNSALR